MKMYLGGVPVKTMKVNHFTMDTNDCTMEPSDLQAGITGVSKGRKIVGTGKCFEFAMYGGWMTNLPVAIPTTINTIQIGSVNYPVRTIVPIHNTTPLDFTTPQTVAEVTIGGAVYPITVLVQNGMLMISCDHTIDIELFYGKDRYTQYG